MQRTPGPGDRVRGNVSRRDPARLALLIMQASEVEQPPVHLFAGKISNELAVQKTAAVSLDLAAWRGASEASNFVE